MTTKSELLFEQFCRSRGMTCRRVPEATKARPDYEVRIADMRLLVEIKQFDPNEEERAAITARERGEHVALGGTPGERVRRAIRAANTQFKQLLSDQSVPTLLIVYNNTPCSLHTRPYALMTAMRGLDVADVEVPAALNESPRFLATRSGPERAMRSDANTSTSAVGVLRDIDEGGPRLIVYHNEHATCRLKPNRMHLPGVLHLRLPAGARNSLEAEWEEA